MAAGSYPSPTFGTVTAKTAVVFPDGSQQTSAAATGATGPAGPTGATGPAVTLATAAPKMDGTAAAGSAATASASDHVHPSDTTRLAVANNLSELANVLTALGNLGFGASLGANGYLRIPNPAGKPVILQWLTLSTTGDQVFSWPIQFPNACWGAFAAIGNTNSNGAFAVNTDSVGQTSAYIRPRYVNNGGGVGVSGANTVYILGIGD